MKKSSANPTILVIGGGAIGTGAEALYADAAINLVGIDAYASPHTRLIADGHALPFPSNSFDGVWIQAVLQLVLDPQQVVAEIHRVLKPEGTVFADTAFMQQLHEQAYDFTRFTLSGHRWLFRRFEEIDAGIARGAGTALFWSLRYAFRSLGMGDLAARVAALPFFWVRFLDKLGRGGKAADAASGVFFLGRKAGSVMTPQEIVQYYSAHR